MADFFISYNKADRGWAEWIAWQLEGSGYTTVIQAWDFRPGQNFVLAMNKAARDADRTVLVLSPDYLGSQFTQPEWAAAFAQDPTGERLLPVRVKECETRGLLGPIIYIDLVGQPEDKARTALLAGARKGRGKPTAAPAFPSSAKKGPSFPGSSSAVARRAGSPARSPTKAPNGTEETDDAVLRSIRARHLVEVDTLDLDYHLARVFRERADIEAIVNDAESLLRSVDPRIDERAAIFGAQNLPSPPASAQRIWRAILSEAPLKGPRALAAILLRAKRLSGSDLPKLNAVLRALVAAPAGAAVAEGLLARKGGTASRTLVNGKNRRESRSKGRPSR